LPETDFGILRMKLLATFEIFEIIGQFCWQPLGVYLLIMAGCFPNTILFPTCTETHFMFNRRQKYSSALYWQ